MTFALFITIMPLPSTLYVDAVKQTCVFSQVQSFDDILHSPEEINNFVFAPMAACIESYQRFFDDALQKLLKLNRGGSIVCVLNHCESSGKGGNSYAEFRRIVMKHSREARSHGICVNGAVYQVSY